MNFVVSLVVCVGLANASTEICPTGERYGGLCYFIISPVQMDWSQAKRKCAESEATLAIPRSQSVQDFIWDLAEREFQQVQRTSLWIGCNDIKEEGNWQHCPLKGDTNGYENWASGEPNDQYGADCAVMWEPQNGEWDDQDCTYPANYPVCELPVVSITQVSTPQTDTAVRLTPQCLLQRALEEFENGALSCQSHPRCHSFSLLEQDGGKKVCPPSNATEEENDGGI